MAERHPGRIEHVVDHEPPTEVLKLAGNPIIEPAKGRTYGVNLPLNRAMTEFEQEAVGQRTTNAGIVYAHHDNPQMLAVTNTTIEAVRDWVDELKAVVRDIAAHGENLRAASAARLEKIRQESADSKAEAERRAELAKSINLDD